MKRIGLDVGSTTIKAVVLDENEKILLSLYERHKSNIKEKTIEVLERLNSNFPQQEFILSISGSSGIGLAEILEVDFVQEVFALQKAIEHYHKETNVAIELGGEDAKILFLSPVNECRMNGSCAGGTGAFIDQMAQLLDTDAAGIDALANNSQKIYTIASRCGVFAKSDIQPLLNQGANKSDIALSILQAIVNQTVSGLAQGRKIEGNVLYIGGPLHFISNLRSAFDKTLNLKGLMPENSLYFVALGSIFATNSLNIGKGCNLLNLVEKLKANKNIDKKDVFPPLFASEDEYNEFVQRHEEDNKCIKFKSDCDIQEGYLGFDAGSTTIKAVLIDKDKNIVDYIYKPNNGNSVDLLLEYIKNLYKKYPKLKIVQSCATGYGEELVKNAFGVDCGIVETMAHFTAAKHFVKDVDFIIDIGGQDIKCFLIRNGAIDSLFLNEACSSGCGSFLLTFATLAGYSIKEFSSLALKSKSPCDLGSRCTVFMNSSVKQAQKDGATIEDIAAGLSISVVKNALYKVIRTSKNAIGKNIVVQGGTFLSDAVLRSFEKEIGKNCIRPKIAGLMGAFGCALFACENSKSKTDFISRENIDSFSYKAQSVICQGCENHCHLTINTFGTSSRFVSGNKCEKPLGLKKAKHYNIYDYKKELLKAYINSTLSTEKINIGLPLGLNMYELLPFWFTLFTSLGFNVITSQSGSRKLYLRSGYSVPSDTVCYPAKLIHGCICDLQDRGVDIIFYPNMTYNVDENNSDNHYNCPVVAYYPEVLDINYDFVNAKYFSPFVDLANRKKFPKFFYKRLRKEKIKVSYSNLKIACKRAYDEYDKYLRKIREKTNEFLNVAKDENMPVILLAGRPYHIDSEINHSLDSLVCDLGGVVISEDGFDFSHDGKISLSVLNQWTYHSRLFASASFVANHINENINLVQLVSFGCGIDAITQDECRKIIEKSGKVYTSIKIDEVANLGATKIRLRSLFAVIGNNYYRNIVI